jgi:hypothetical protein
MGEVGEAAFNRCLLLRLSDYNLRPERIVKKHYTLSCQNVLQGKNPFSLIEVLFIEEHKSGVSEFLTAETPYRQLISRRCKIFQHH